MAQIIPNYLMGAVEVDTSPLRNALYKWSDDQFRREQADIANTFRERSLGLDEKRFGLEAQRAADEREAKLAQRFAGIAQMIQDEKDPVRQRGMFEKFMAADPRIANVVASLPAEARGDHLAVTKYLVGLARGYQDPLEVEAKRAQIAASRAAAANAIAAGRRADELHPFEVLARQKALEGEKYGTIKENEQLYVRDPSAPGGVRFIEAPGGTVNREFRTAAAKQNAESLGKLVEGANQQAEVLSDLQTMSALSDRIGQPGLANTVKQVLGPIANRAGINIAGLNDIEAFQAVVARTAPRMRPPGSGATSDFEMRQFLSALPQLSQSLEGRRRVIATLEALARYNVDRGKIASAALTGRITPQQAEEMLQALPSPTAEWGKGQAPGASQAAPAKRGANPYQSMSDDEILRALGGGR